MRSQRTFPVPHMDDLYLRLLNWCEQERHYVFFNRNNYRHPGFAQQWLVACGAIEQVGGASDGLAALYAAHRRCPDWWFGYLGYDLRKVLEPSSHRRRQPDARVAFDDLFFFRPRHVFQLHEQKLTIESIDDAAHVWKQIWAIQPRPLKAALPITMQCRTSLQDYREAFDLIRQHLAAGDIYEINYCIEFVAQSTGLDPLWMMQCLNQHAPAPFSCLLRHAHRYVVGASPERFIRKKGTTLIAQPMKGTADPRQNASEATLALDPKEQSENVMIVDLMRNDLTRCAIPGTVQVKELFGVYAFPGVLQMISTIEAQLRNDIPFTDVLRYAFPPGSMTGAPKVKAMQLIEQYEPISRGLYAGITGYITPQADFDFNVVIRSFLYDAENGNLSLHTGSGITWYANATAEFEECFLKARSVTSALPGFQLMR